MVNGYWYHSLNRDWEWGLKWKKLGVGAGNTWEMEQEWSQLRKAWKKLEPVTAEEGKDVVNLGS